MCKPHRLAVLWYFLGLRPRETLSPVLQETGSRMCLWPEVQTPYSSRAAGEQRWGRARAGGRTGQHQVWTQQHGKFSETRPRGGGGENQEAESMCLGDWYKHRNTRLIILPVIQSHEKAEEVFVSNMADSEESERSPNSCLCREREGTRLWF